MAGRSTSEASATVKLASLFVSLGRLDGGGIRVQAFMRSLESLGCRVDAVGLGPRSSDAMDMVVQAPLHRLKRRVLPIAFRAPLEAALPPPLAEGCAVSLIPAANRWALASGSSWLDFPDLNSNMARNHARSVDFISGALNRAQARLWARREYQESVQATVVSTASWSDAQELGERAVWMPTPVAESANQWPRRSVRIRDEPIYGMLANFHYPPNRDAYLRLIREQSSPQLDGSRIIVAGFGSESLPRVPGIDIIGSVRRVSEFYDAVDIVVAPIELGGGMKVKVVEAMMYGVPVIASQHALDGLPPTIASACFKWGTAAIRATDPRTNNSVADALRDFTSDSFERKFAETWRANITNKQ